ncbi:MMPL family transporter [Chengkuizengella sediminis]|uniref:MMPL/RND family transporter n=1 Tax=Chengkuizengella sediminis TaxID=1885917 RepID=UPI0013895581|nr:MMPL family transporter [Chengkuizengella sediminis]NDI36282.1 MMPL family transporter [Chengkuizengella sediminis]
MRSIIKFRWGIAIFWIIAIFLFVSTMPNMDALVREKGQAKIPEDYSSLVAVDFLNELEGQPKDVQSINVVVIFNEAEALTEAQMTNIKTEIEGLNEKKDELGINQITTHFNNEELTDQFVSKDMTTVMAVLSMDRAGRKVSELRDELEVELQDIEVKTYLTGNQFINEDQLLTTGKGVKKTELFTVLFIVIVLVLVFRSPVTPVISLLTVGITYACSLSIIAHLVDKLNFPFSSTTQTFLILVLFGIGTDYNILFLSRFKEELSRGLEIPDAIVQTFKTAGKTVFYSGLAVFIGFSILGFAKFSIFQSSVAVAVAIATLLVALYTLMPFFMMVIGRFLFWPVKESHGHGESKIWLYLGRFSLTRPFVSLLIVAVVTVPFLLTYTNQVSYNSIDEVSDSYESVQGFKLLSEKFTPGKALPSTVVLKAKQQLDNNEQLDWLDGLTEKISRIDGVETVYGPTRPKGEKNEDLYLEEQVGDVGSGISDANEGIDQISEGISEVNEKISPSDPDQVDALINGTEEIAAGLNQMETEVRKSNDQLNTQTAKVEATIKKEIDALNEKWADFNQLALDKKSELERYRTVIAKAEDLQSQLLRVQTILDTIIDSVTELSEKYPEFHGDQDVANLKAASQQITELNNALTAAINGAKSSYYNAVNELSNLQSLQAEMSAYLSEIQTKLSSGLTDINQGQEELLAGIVELEKGINQVNDGQKRLKSGLVDMSENIKKLEEGLSKSTEGLDEISSGLVDAISYLDEVTSESETATFYVPDEMLVGEYQQILNAYMSDDRKMVKFNVELAVDPYSIEAMNIIDEIKTVVTAELKTSQNKDAIFAIGGISSTNNDLDAIVKADFNRTVVLMLFGIFIVLIVILREFWLPVFIIASLILGYYTALTITNLLVINILGYSGLSWTIPFFSFIMIIALGVDYSIFVMMRYKEYKDHHPMDALLLAKQQIGKVVIAAAFILCGTFAAMYPANVLSLTQIATVVIIGLFLLTFVMIPMLIPGLFAIRMKLSKQQSKLTK